MFGKIVPYVIVGFVQATLIVGDRRTVFGVTTPFLAVSVLALLTTLFITVTWRSATVSTIVQNQLPGHAVVES